MNKQTVNILKVFTPFKTLNSTEKWISTVLVIMLVFGIWASSGSEYIPDPWEVFGAFPKLISQKDVFWHFQKSLGFCFKAIMYSTVIALVVCYISVLPLFRTLCEFLRKFRFLPSTGLSWFFLKISGGFVESQMLWMMIFGVTTWMIYGFVGIALDISHDEVNYAKSLRLSRWQMMREILIYGKGAQIMESAIGCFAIAWLLLASIENIAKASGGIGVVLSESNKYYKFAEVYAIQLMILFTGIFIDLFLRWLRTIFFPYTDIKN